VIRLEPCPVDAPSLGFSRGKLRPRAIAWFGFTSFWGHLRHLLASAIATDSVDSRAWMIPDASHDLLGRALSVLEPRGARASTTLAGAFGGQVWIDFVADTGDDVTVSGAVARLLSSEYEVLGHGVLPRGQVLIHGGDLAYPVATVREMARRLVGPWNAVLEAETDAHEAPPRVLLGVPGNHDWYDGLDGFSRLCQAPCAFEEPAKLGDALHPHAEENPVLAWAEAFASGDKVNKPGAMALAGYVAVQHASYFRLPLARGLELCGVDRQLRGVDARQRAFFRARVPGVARVVILPDPARAWGETRSNGAATLAALGLDPAIDATLVLAGDVHHYERSHEHKSVHVVAGGGGAFLQGARIPQTGAAYERVVEFPGPRASWAMCKKLPWHLASGGAGWVITSLLAIGNTLALVAYFRHGVLGAAATAGVMSALVALATALLVGWRRHRTHLVVPFAAMFGVLVGALPVALGVAADVLGVDELGSAAFGRVLAVFVAMVLSTFASGFGFGAMLMVIARLGLNHAQPFAGLGIGGFKHFVRMRVREIDGQPSSVEAFVIGVVDPVKGSAPVLVDVFRWDAMEGPRAPR
jgi:hypothetical protein